ncbi:hypothetical protein [Burkholderia ubonensis]|uniref:hypothetical protein n=1 Tax=Burkholderia ubonensis TaxID=101571 RepID=UPI0012FB759A|nr:hypothetical protein [Burkholderia ubonensis]
MTAILELDDQLSWAGTPGATQDAIRVEVARDDAFNRTKEIFSRTSAVVSELMSAASENDRVSAVTLNKAFKFVLALPSDVNQPEVSVDPDGEVAFDWANDKDLLSVSVGGSGRVTYAGRLDAKMVSGTVRIANRIPASLGDALRAFRSA